MACVLKRGGRCEERQSGWPVKTGTRGRRPCVNEGRGWSHVAVSRGTPCASDARSRKGQQGRPCSGRGLGPRRRPPALARASEPPGPRAGSRLAFHRTCHPWDLGPALPGSPRGAPGCRPFPDDRAVNTDLTRCQRAGSARPAPARREPATRENRSRGRLPRPAPLTDRERPVLEFSKKRVNLVIFAAASSRTRQARLGLTHQPPRPYASILFLQYSESHTPDTV